MASLPENLVSKVFRDFEINMDMLARDFTSKVILSGKDDLDATSILMECNLTPNDIEELFFRYLDVFCSKCNMIFHDSETGYTLFSNRTVRKPRGWPLNRKY